MTSVSAIRGAMWSHWAFHHVFGSMFDRYVSCLGDFRVFLSTNYAIKALNEGMEVQFRDLSQRRGGLFLLYGVLSSKDWGNKIYIRT